MSLGSMPSLPMGVPRCGHNSLFPRWSSSLRRGSSKSIRGSLSLELGCWEQGIACAWSGGVIDSGSLREVA